MYHIVFLNCCCQKLLLLLLNKILKCLYIGLSLQSKIHAGVEVLLKSMEASQELLKPLDDEWSLPNFPSLAIAKDLGRKHAEAGADRKKARASEPSRKVTCRNCGRATGNAI
jgi:hypothetical protein